MNRRAPAAEDTMHRMRFELPRDDRRRRGCSTGSVALCRGPDDAGRAAVRCPAGPRGRVGFHRMSDTSPPPAEKPDAAAKKAFKAAMKSLDKAKEYEAAAAGADESRQEGQATWKRWATNTARRWTNSPRP